MITCLEIQALITSGPTAEPDLQKIHVVYTTITNVRVGQVAFFNLTSQTSALILDFAGFKGRNWPTKNYLTQNRPGNPERFLGGDGGNRTRVRKNRPLNLYERSRLFSVIRLQVNRLNYKQIIRLSPKALFGLVHGLPDSVPAFMTP